MAKVLIFSFYYYYYCSELTRPFDEDAIEKVLDIGCGPNLPWSIDFAASHPNAHVIGMDVLDKATDIIIDLPSNCELIKHNCIKPFPMEPNSIDLCHIRFMNTSFTMEQYKKVVENCWRVLKPGGYIEIMEMDTLVYSPGPMT
ncbi:S-adenosyl-L-methionine-dependent methyltransferase, partial [Cunninghamella echinulata]